MKQLIMAALMLCSLSSLAQVKQCKGTTKAGKPCRQVIIDSTGYCQFHTVAGIRCGFKTTKGKPCRMSVKKEGDRCRFHIGK